MHVLNSLDVLHGYIEAYDFAGYDPYDALNSPFLSALGAHHKYIRIAFTQFLKRSPVNVRPLLSVARGHNPKGLGLFLWGYAKLCARAKDPLYLGQIEKLLDYLDGCKTETMLDSGLRRNDKGSGHGWGYNFDWQSRAFFIPKYTPTIVNSAFIGHALLDTWKLVGNERARHMALPIATFILNELNRQHEDGTICFSYTPLDQYYVHNANLLGASLLIRLYQETDDRELRDTALAALAFSMRYQRDDGSWFYSEKKSAHWIDSFHTGFNLQAIRHFLDLGFGEEYRSHYDRGVHFYSENFFLADGTPKYYHDRLYPIDIHCPAQAVVFFSGMGEEYQGLVDRVARWMITHMQDEAGYFYFQKHPRYTNRIPYMRWGQAWAFHALTEYLFQSKT